MTNITDIDTTAFDLESTGLDTSEDRIVEFGATIFKAGKFSSRGRVLVNPGKEIAAEARKVHRITNERVKDCPIWADVLPRIRTQFEAADILVGYNCLHFDVPMMDSEAERAGSDWRINQDIVLDIMIFVNWHHRSRRLRKQELIAPEEYGLEFSGDAHSAAADTQVTGELLFAMIKAGVIPEDMAEALKQQAELRPIIEKEFKDWGPWLYRDRQTRRLHIGAGKNTGKLLADVPKTYYGWILGNIKDLPLPAKRAFEAAKAGRTQDEIQESLFDETADGDGGDKNDSDDDVAGWGG